MCVGVRLVTDKDHLLLLLWDCGLDDKSSCFCP